MRVHTALHMCTRTFPKPYVQTHMPPPPPHTSMPTPTHHSHTYIHTNPYVHTQSITMYTHPPRHTDMLQPHPAVCTQTTMHTTAVHTHTCYHHAHTHTTDGHIPTQVNIAQTCTHTSQLCTHTHVHTAIAHRNPGGRKGEGGWAPPLQAERTGPIFPGCGVKRGVERSYRLHCHPGPMLLNPKGTWEPRAASPGPSLVRGQSGPQACRNSDSHPSSTLRAARGLSEMMNVKALGKL